MTVLERWNEAQLFLSKGGPAIWAIALLSVLTLTLILWKTWNLSCMGAWAGKTTERAVRDWCAGDTKAAQDRLKKRRNLRATVARAAMETHLNPAFSDSEKREEILRIAKAQLARARTGLRPLELISTIAPLLGLLGTVLGMIAAFQTLQEAGSRADPAALAGGIWEALLTTAAGMAVAIPASAALTWFESVADKSQADMEDAITRILTRNTPTKVRSNPALQAAE